MSSEYFKKHPEIKEFRCRKCRKMKLVSEMFNNFKCKSCNRAKNIKTAYMSKIRSKTSQNDKIELTMREKARICELHVGAELTMEEVARVVLRSEKTVFDVLQDYFGNENSRITATLSEKSFSNTTDAQSDT